MKYQNLKVELKVIKNSKMEIFEKLRINSFFNNNDTFLDFYNTTYIDFISLIENNFMINKFDEYIKTFDFLNQNSLIDFFTCFKNELFSLKFENINIEIYKDINNSLDEIYKFLNSNNIEYTNNEIEKKDKKIVRLTRMAQMGEMISMIAHQWRQPLNNISMIVSTQKIEVELNEFDTKNIIQTLDEIASQVKYLSYTIDDFRNFFNPNKSKSKINLNEVIDKSLSIISSSLEYNGIEVIKDYHFQKEIHTHSNELIQVVLNLLKNSQDALLENSVKKPMIIIIGYDNETNQTIEILDNGGGISKDIIDKIFDAYFTTKGEEEGTGLGLNLAKTIIENNCGGKLLVENLDECGVKFTIILPLK